MENTVDVVENQNYEIIEVRKPMSKKTKAIIGGGVIAGIAAFAAGLVYKLTHKGGYVAYDVEEEDDEEEDEEDEEE